MQNSAAPDHKNSPAAENDEELIMETESATLPQAESESEPANGGVASEAQQWQDRFIRLAADFANYKRRSENARAEIADWARRDFALALLPVLDDFGLMMEYEAQNPERLAEGAKMIRQKMLELLTKHGLEKTEAVNQPYDYERHEAVLSQPVHDKTLDHVVLSVMQEGYLFKGKVLRPAKVIVGQYAEKATTISSPASD